MGEPSWNCRRGVVQQMSRLRTAVSPSFASVGAAAEDACDGRQAGAADDAIGIGVGEVVDVGAEKGVVACR